MKLPTTTTAALAAALLMLLTAPPAPAQMYEDDSYDYGYGDTELRGEERSDIEWEPGTGYHEEEWYDPSDWFDTDEGVEYEDYGTRAYDDGYDYGYGDSYATDGAYYEYVEEVREARRDLATGEIDLEEYRDEIAEAEQLLYQDAGYGYDDYGYYDTGYDWYADDWDDDWYGTSDEWWGYEGDYDYDWDWGWD